MPAARPMLWVSLAFALSCSSGADPAESPDADGTTSQPWYSTDPYNQHGKITCGAVHDANPWANSVGLGAAFWPCDQTNYLLFHTYGGALVSGNVDTDRKSGPIESYFRTLYDDRYYSDNHHFQRSGTESAFFACIQARQDMKRVTAIAVDQYRGGNSQYFYFTVGHVTHTVQDSYAPAHTRRDASNTNRLIDVCTTPNVSIPGACRHPAGTLGLFTDGDNVDKFPALEEAARQATIQYLNAVASDLTTSRRLGSTTTAAVDASFDVRFGCRDLLLPADMAFAEPPMSEVEFRIANAVVERCLDIQSGRISSGTAIWLWACNGTAAQKWRIGANGELRVARAPDLCLDAGGGNERDPVTVAACNGRSSQRWSVLANRQIRSDLGLCLDRQWGASDIGTPLWMWRCNGTQAQAWVYQ